MDAPTTVNFEVKARPSTMELVEALTNHISRLQPEVQEHIEKLIDEGKMKEAMRLLKEQSGFRGK